MLGQLRNGKLCKESVSTAGFTLGCHHSIGFTHVANF